MQYEEFCVISFDTSHQAIAAEVAVTGLEGVRLIPLPPEISHGCGLALKVSRHHVRTALELLQASGAVYQDVYLLQLSASKRTAIKMP